VFYDRDVAIVARALLGAVLRCETAEGVASGVIVETEAYRGIHDPASHAQAGRTARTRHLFGVPGTIYVYRSYGLHWCVNAVSATEGEGSAVLVRALRPLEGLDLMQARRLRARRPTDLCSGPGKLCEALGITRDAHDGAHFARGALTIHAGETIPDDRVRVTARIGITKAADWPLRFLVADDPHVSRARPARTPL
jgi:DNA-3-methyladenine glycosylase